MPSRRVIHHHSRLGPASAPTTWKMPMTTRNQLNTTDRTNRVMPGQMNAITPAITESRPLTTYSQRQQAADAVRQHEHAEQHPDDAQQQEHPPAPAELPRHLEPPLPAHGFAGRAGLQVRDVVHAILPPSSRQTA